MRKNTFVVSKIKKIKIKGEENPLYLVKWKCSNDETWEPASNFNDKLENYPGYKESVHNLFRIRKKKEKNAVYIMINHFLK